MNFRLIARFLGIVSILIGVSMLFSLLWAMPQFGGVWENEASGVRGLLISSLISCLLGKFFFWFGKKNTNLQLLRRESLAVVGLSWILAAFLGALPYLISGSETSLGVPMSFADAIFESQSGFSTTGASVINDVENPLVLPRTILFWRCTTHFLGGLGIMVLFVVILGQGSTGKAIMRIEKGAGSESNPIAKMRQLAIGLLRVYLGLNGILILILVSLNVSWFDAICLSFSTVATGGFSTFNSSIGHFAANTTLNSGLIESVIIFFMICAGTNFSLLYLFAIGQPLKLFRDTEWRTYIGILIVATFLIFVSGIYWNDFDIYGTSDKPMISIPDAVSIKQNLETTVPLQESQSGIPVSVSSESYPIESSESQPIENQLIEVAKYKLPWHIAFRNVVFSVASIMTTTGFCVDEQDSWNSLSLFIITILMFTGGCAGSTAGGIKVFRSIIMFKTFGQEIEKSYRPNVIRTLKLDGQNVDRSVQTGILIFILFFAVSIALFTTLILMIEPNTQWTSQGLGYSEKITDVFAATLSSFTNTGVGFGVAGARSNFSGFSDLSKLILSITMFLGRLELYVGLVLILPSFWKKH